MYSRYFLLTTEDMFGYDSRLVPVCTMLDCSMLMLNLFIYRIFIYRRKYFDIQHIHMLPVMLNVHKMMWWKNYTQSVWRCMHAAYKQSCGRLSESCDLMLCIRGLEPPQAGHCPMWKIFRRVQSVRWLIFFLKNATAKWMTRVVSANCAYVLHMQSEDALFAKYIHPWHWLCIGVFEGNLVISRIWPSWILFNFARVFIVDARLSWQPPVVSCSPSCFNFRWAIVRISHWYNSETL